MEKRYDLGGKWSLSFGHAGECDFSAVNNAETASKLLKTIPATVPGNLELDLCAAGLINDPFYGKNILDTMTLEDVWMLYSRPFEYEPKKGCDTYLVFEGLDCIADIYIDGEAAAHTKNMLIPNRIPINIGSGKHELFVKIAPAASEARKHEIYPYMNCLPYSYDSLHVRKAPHMYGWDIMPRAVSGGIWRPVYLEYVPRAHIDDIYAVTDSIDDGSHSAAVVFYYNLRLPEDAGDIRRWSLRISGECVDSSFACEKKLWHTGGKLECRINDAKLWECVNYGEPNLYACRVVLLHDGTEVDTHDFRFGIRTIQLHRTSTADRDGNGEFCFIINGHRTFVLGSNWVPADAYHSRDRGRLPRMLPLVSELGCNMLRCWGGNVYEDDYFYDWCDEHGVMVWQDFAMACGSYPVDDAFKAAISEETAAVVRRLRAHASLVLWSGDNECDQSVGKWRLPSENIITREVIPAVLKLLDPFRPYLPSSPYIDTEVERSGKAPSEDHLWGPRDYFKGDYYRNTVCHFASETGYHGCPSVKSLEKFIPAESLTPILGNPYWIIHSASPEETADGTPYGYRTKLMWDQVRTLFGEAPDDLRDFSLASQISQAEAMKYFIERFRMTMWRRTGIIWWNVIDGWPQISDAVVDYYFERKLAFWYIKRSQNPFCIMADEPANGEHEVYAVNERNYIVAVRYEIIDAATGETVTGGVVEAAPHSSVKAGAFADDGGKRFLLIKWDGTEAGTNHYFTNILDIDYYAYVKAAKVAGYAEFSQIKTSEGD